MSRQSPRYRCHLGCILLKTARRYRCGQAAKASALSPLQKQIAQSCVPVRLERGDTLYLPAGVVHRAASPDNATSLHCSVSVSRTHHHHSWATFLAAVLRSATPPLSTDKVGLCNSWMFRPNAGPTAVVWARSDSFV